LEALEDRCLLSNYATGPLVQVSVTNPFADSTADHPETQPGTFAPDSEVEPYVVVDPTDRHHLVGIWQQDRWSGNGSRGLVVGVTFDGGRSWQEVVPQGLSQVAGGPFQRASDDWLSFAPNGDLYLSALSFNTADVPPDIFGESTVMASKSTDGGLTWSNPVTVTDTTDAFNDKEVITADPLHPNTAYLVWTTLSPVGVFGSTALFSRTTDGGQTWEQARVIFDAGPGIANRPVQIVVEPDGTLVYFATTRRLSPLSTPELIILRSADQGESWQDPIQIGLMETIGVTDPNNGRTLRNGPIIYGATIDPNNGNLYVAWQDARFSQGQHDSIAFAMSRDEGLTWSQPIQISQTPTDIPVGDQQAWRPSIAVARNGTVAVTYYDFRFHDSSPGLPTDYWFVRGDPHGHGGLTNPANWGDELRLTNSSFDMEKAPDVSGPFVGDYQGLAAVGNSFAPLFAQPHGTDPDSIFFRRIDVSREHHHHENHDDHHHGRGQHRGHGHEEDHGHGRSRSASLALTNSQSGPNGALDQAVARWLLATWSDPSKAPASAVETFSPQSRPLVSEATAVEELYAAQVTSNSSGKKLTGKVGRDLFFGKSALDLTDRDALTENSVEL
jgi:hypothetical protein